MKRNKILISVLSLVIITVLVVTAAAVTKTKSTSASGTYESKYVNRVNIQVENTDFEFEKPADDGSLYCVTTVKIEKTEADFYGKIDSITLDGQDFGYIIYTAGENNGENAELPENVLITASEEDNAPMEWEIAFTIPYTEGQSSYDVTLNINYTTGVKTTVTQSYLTSVPITVNVTE
ncbi:MAG: hypothetical protein LUG85_04170 [Clostridiales bacterium]|nr:hypothetical protein [Clostridiales bacterium]